MYLWLGCKPCQSIKPIITKYAQENDIQILYKAPVAVEKWALDGKVFHAMELSGNAEHIDDLFKLYTKNTEANISTNQQHLIEFLKSRNIDMAHFNNVFKSEELSDKLFEINHEYIINGWRGVPKLVVNGKYAVEMAGIASVQDLYDLLDFLNKLE